MHMSAPKVFVSHASEDKLSFAEPLAAALRTQGIDAWLDKWELVPGDSLVHKVFEQGLGNASTVIFIMSPRSVDKPWVKAELDNAVTRHIKGELRLIPVLMEPCDVPQSVKALLWIDAPFEGSVDAVAEKIAKAIYGHTERPPLGAKPSYVDASKLEVAGLSSTDALVLELVFQVAAERGRRFIQTPHLMKAAEPYGMDVETLKETTDVFCEMGYLVDQDKTLSGRHIVVELPYATMIDIAGRLGFPMNKLRCQISGLILNENVTNIAKLRSEVDGPPGLADALLDELEGNTYITLQRAMGGGGMVHSPSALFKRWFRQTC